MRFKAIAFIFYLLLLSVNRILAQINNTQQGLILKCTTDIRLGNVQVMNKHSLAKTKSNVVGVFNIAASSGDTLTFNSEGYQEANFIVSDKADQVIYLNPAIQLPEVYIQENSISQDILETKMGYRRKSVFYTGTPHYYYLLLKPMTFIYENFKSEVIEARRFNRYANKELISYR